MRKHTFAPADPPPFSVERPQGAAPFLLTCDHASRLLPARLGTLGLTEVELGSHVAWDIGAAGLARRLAEALDAFLILQTYSRLAIDCNRPLVSPDSIVTKSERTQIAANRALPAGEAERRAREIFQPYHDRIRAELDARAGRGQPTVLIAMHSFTPVFHGIARPWHAGVVYGRDARLARVLLDLLRAEPGLQIGDNQPYRIDDASDYGIPVHGEQRGIPHAMLEIRNDLIATAEGQQQWATRLARVLNAALPSVTC